MLPAQGDAQVVNRIGGEINGCTVAFFQNASHPEGQAVLFLRAFGGDDGRRGHVDGFRLQHCMKTRQKVRAGGSVRECWRVDGLRRVASLAQAKCSAVMVRATIE
jgi:hypothetical protein